MIRTVATSADRSGSFARDRGFVSPADAEYACVASPSLITVGD